MDRSALIARAYAATERADEATAQLLAELAAALDASADVRFTIRHNRSGHLVTKEEIDVVFRGGSVSGVLVNTVWRDAAGNRVKPHGPLVA